MRGVAVALHIAQHNVEKVAFQCAALELAAVSRGIDDAEFGMFQRCPIGIAFARHLQRKRLSRDGMSILHAGKTDVTHVGTGEACQLARHPFGIGAALFHAQKNVLAGAIGDKTQIFIDDEIFRARTQSTPVSGGPP